MLLNPVIRFVVSFVCTCLVFGSAYGFILFLKTFKKGAQ